MDDGHGGGLGPFLRLLASRPHPDEVAAAIGRGPLDDLDVASARIFWRRDPMLHLLGMDGYLSGPEAGYQDVDLSLDIPICGALREGEVLVVANRDAAQAYQATTDVRSRWTTLNARYPDGSMICAPIDSRGVMIGGLALITSSSTPLSSWQLARVQCVCAGLSLWMSHPDTGIPWPVRGRRPSSLTERQVAILALAAAGQSTPAIGRRLGFSASTIKQDLHRTMRTLECSTREEAVAEARRHGWLEDQP